MIFSQIQNTVPNTAAEGSEITGIRLQSYLGQHIDDGIEAFLEERKHLSFTAAVLIGSNHIVFRLLIQNLNHIPHNFRTLLQVCVDQGGILTHSLLQTCIDSSFFAKVSGEGDHLDRAFLCGVNFL